MVAHMQLVVALHQHTILPLLHLTPMPTVPHCYHMSVIHYIAMVLQHLVLLPITVLLDLLPITVLQVIQLITVALHPTHMVHIPGTGRHSIFFLLSILHILNFNVNITNSRTIFVFSFN